MKKSGVKNRLTLNEMSLNLAIMVIFLVLGIAAGCIFAGNAESELLSRFIGSDIKNIAGDPTQEYSFLKTFFNLVKYPLFSLILSFTAFGVIMIPCVVFAKGFIISLSVSSIIAIFGKKAIFMALSIFGIQTIISVPCILIVSAVAFDVSKSFTFLFKRRNVQIPAKRAQAGHLLILFIFVLFVLFLTALADAAITPRLAAVSANSILL